MVYLCFIIWNNRFGFGLSLQDELLRDAQSPPEWPPVGSPSACAGEPKPEVAQTMEEQTTEQKQPEVAQTMEEQTIEQKQPEVARAIEQKEPEVAQTMEEQTTEQKQPEVAQTMEEQKQPEAQMVAQMLAQPATPVEKQPEPAVPKEPLAVAAVQVPATTPMPSVAASLKAPETAEVAASVKSPETSEVAAPSRAPETSEVAAPLTAPETTEVAVPAKAPETSEVAVPAKTPETSEVAAPLKAPETSVPAGKVLDTAVQPSASAAPSKPAFTPGPPDRTLELAGLQALMQQQKLRESEAQSPEQIQAILAGRPVHVTAPRVDVSAVNWVSHKKEGMRLKRLMEESADGAKNFPHLHQMWQGSMAEPW